MAQYSIFVLGNSVTDLLRGVDLGCGALEGADGVEVGYFDRVLDVVEELLVGDDPD